MTPQERELVADLFARLAKLEGAPRDPDAERLMVEGLRQAPHAVYALVQTALVQDEALKRANARIQELQAQLGEGEEPPRQAGFLDTMRDALLGPREQQSGSVPSIRPQQSSATGSSSVWGNQQAQPAGYPPQPGAYPPGGNPAGGNPAGGNPAAGYPPGAYPQQTGFGGGGSFLGTAASAAAGVIGGSLMLDGIRSMMGGHRGSAFGGTDPSTAGSFGDPSPWSSGGGELSRQAGLDDIGRSSGASQDSGQDRAGLFDTAADDGNADNVDVGDDSADFGSDDGGSDYA